MIKIQKASIFNVAKLAKMIGRQWDLGKKATGKSGTCDYLYAFEIIMRTNEFIKIRENGKTVGFAGVEIYGSRRAPIQRFISKIMFNIIVAIQPRKIRKLIKRYYAAYDYLPKKFEGQFDSDETIIIISQGARRKGFGNALFNKLCDISKKHNARNLRIDTDDSCGVDFYIKNGCREIFRKKSTNKTCDPTKNFYTFLKEL
ncbi:MAG: hypothetical protein FWD33_00470 [Alphaproteobacteria bacterium]|nr:hypothetical protein [Alphaproteobacteria bacterium]